MTFLQALHQSHSLSKLKHRKHQFDAGYLRKSEHEVYETRTITQLLKAESTNDGKRLP